jgi:hypothetical protein
MCGGNINGLHDSLEDAETEAGVWLSYGPYETIVIPCTQYVTDPEE